MGRKSLKEEIRVVEYMTELAPQVFKIIEEELKSKNKKDRRWAVEQMNKLYSKAVPIGFDPKAPLNVKQITGMEITDDDADPEDKIQDKES